MLLLNNLINIKNQTIKAIKIMKGSEQLSKIEGKIGRSNKYASI